MHVLLLIYVINSVIHDGAKLAMSGDHFCFGRLSLALWTIADSVRGGATLYVFLLSVTFHQNMRGLLSSQNDGA